MRGSAKTKKKPGVRTKGGFRPGRPILREEWLHFMECRTWEEAAGLFGTTFAAGESRLSVAEGSAQSRPESSRVYFGIMLLSAERVFADEVLKNEMLAILSEESIRWQIPVADFVLLDDSMYLIVCKNAEGRATELLGKYYEQKIVEFKRSLEDKFISCHTLRQGIPCRFTAGENICRYKSPAQVLQASVQIHTLPAVRGYVPAANLKDYWFSGYIALRGKHLWYFMDPTGMLMDLDDRPGRAVKKLEEAHRAFLEKLS